jgi:hypothetical protein
MSVKTECWILYNLIMQTWIYFVFSDIIWKDQGLIQDLLYTHRVHGRSIEDHNFPRMTTKLVLKFMSKDVGQS